MLGIDREWPEVFDEFRYLLGLKEDETRQARRKDLAERARQRYG